MSMLWLGSGAVWVFSVALCGVFVWLGGCCTGEALGVSVSARRCGVVCACFVSGPCGLFFCRMDVLIIYCHFLLWRFVFVVSLVVSMFGLCLWVACVAMWVGFLVSRGGSLFRCPLFLLLFCVVFLHCVLFRFFALFCLMLSGFGLFLFWRGCILGSVCWVCWCTRA